MLSPHRKDPEGLRATIHRALKREYPDSLGLTQLEQLTGKGRKSVDSALRNLIDADMVEKIAQGQYRWLSDNNSLIRVKSSLRSRVIGALKSEYPGTLSSIQLQERLSEPQNRILNTVQGLAQEGFVESVSRGIYRIAEEGIR